MRKRIEEWYRGPWVTPPDDPSSPLVFMGHYEPHWTARIARTFVQFWLAHWQWVVGTTIALLGLLLAYKRLG